MGVGDGVAGPVMTPLAPMWREAGADAVAQ